MAVRKGAYENAATGRKAGTATVEGYLAALPPDKRAGLSKVRRTLKSLLPKAEECISYGMPAFRHPDGVVAYYAAMKSHLSFFPTSYPIEVCAEELKGYATSRGTIRFPIDAPLPAALVKKLIKVRLAQMAEKRDGRRRGKPARTPGTDPSPKARPRLNADWHKSHRMPPNATLGQRARWHLAHRKACGCREIPASIAAYLESR